MVADLPTLERTIRDLEKSIDSLGIWLTLMTALVVIGLVLECVHEIPEAIEDWKEAADWKERWKPLLIISGVVLITVGVAGELYVQFFASAKETRVRDANHAVVAHLNSQAAIAREEAADASEQSSANEIEAARLRKDEVHDHEPVRMV